MQGGVLTPDNAQQLIDQEKSQFRSDKHAKRSRIAALALGLYAVVLVKANYHHPSNQEIDLWATAVSVGGAFTLFGLMAARSHINSVKNHNQHLRQRVSLIKSQTIAPVTEPEPTAQPDQN